MVHGSKQKILEGSAQGAAVLDAARETGTDGVSASGRVLNMSVLVWID